MKQGEGETADPNSQPVRWHDDAFFGIHYDLHANAQDTELGRELTVEHLVERLSLVRPDWIQCDCKGHPGYTSWPTKIGSTAPGMIHDSLRMHREATNQLGIKLGMHYSGVWDTRALELHPEWARIDEHGVPDGPAGRALQKEATTVVQSADMTCRNSAYESELMIPQMLEIIDVYDVDGFWIDGENWASKPCWCDRCQAEFTHRTGISAIPRSESDEHWDEWLSYHRDLFIEHVTNVANAVHARKPGCLVCSNWMFTMRQPDPITAPVDYLSGDFDHAWGASRAAVEGRLLDGRGLSWDLMAWAFAKTGNMREAPPWSEKTALHLCQEISEVVALGGATMVYNVPQRSGWLTDWHQDLVAEVADFCRVRRDSCFQSTTVPQAAILHTPQHLYAHNQPLFNDGHAADAIEGALHVLLESHISTDILTEEAALERMDRYSLIVVPERTRLSDDIRDALTRYAKAGGHVIISGAHLAFEDAAFVGVSARGEAVTGTEAKTVYLPVGNKAVGSYGPWQPVDPQAGTEVWVYCLSQQQPDRNGTDVPAVTYRAVGKGAIVAVHGPLFGDYFLGHYPLMRQFIRQLIDRLDIPWLVDMDGPARLEMILREKDEKLVINLINRGAGEALSPRRVIVEELPPVENITLRIRHENRPQTISVVPSGPPVDWDYADGEITVRLPRVDIHSAVIVADA